jgi:hypothetical protein
MANTKDIGQDISQDIGQDIGLPLLGMVGSKNC